MIDWQDKSEKKMQELQNRIEQKEEESDFKKYEYWAKKYYDLGDNDMKLVKQIHKDLKNKFRKIEKEIKTESKD
jgi:hypothetical protein